MSFTTLVAADIFGEKINFALSFPSRPALEELNQTIEKVFSTEIENRRPDHVPPHTFHIRKVCLHVSGNSWVAVSSETQLTHQCQLYAFQPTNDWHKESRTSIPEAVPPPRSAAAVTAAALGADTPLRTSRPTTASSAGRSIPRTTRGPPSVSRGAATTAIVPRANGNVSYDEKLRICFSEFDPKGTRSIELDDFQQCFRSLGLDFSAATVEDLFERADLNKDRRISFTEFEHFAKLYPIMTDIVYIRSKAFWEEEHITKSIQAERDTVSKAESALDNANKALSAAQNDVQQAKQAVLDAEADLQERTERMRDLAEGMEDSKRQKEAALREKREREKALQEARERESEARKDLQDLSREADKIERRVGTLVTDATAADEKVRQLQKALEDAKKAADRAHHLAEQGALEAEQAREREKDAELELETVARELPKTEDAVRTADRNVSYAEQVIRELDSAGKDLGRDADEAARRKEHSEAAVSTAQEKASQRTRDVEKARQQVEEREKQVKAREAELEEHRRQREEASQYERLLIERELRLRETRDSLEQNESTLHNEAADFLANLRAGGGGSAGRSYSRDPSNF